MKPAKRRQIPASELFPRRRRRLKRAGGAGQLELLTPLLRRALRAAKERFSKLPGVEGVGIGMPYSESRSAYRHTGTRKALCVKVLVKNKIKPKVLPKS